MHPLNVKVAKYVPSELTNYELRYGAEKSNAREKAHSALTKLLSPITIVSFTSKAAIESAIIRAALEKQGLIIGIEGIKIRGHAKSRGLILVTNNVREFGRIPGLELENWYE